MSGPFLLRYVHLFVKELSVGAFILSRDGRSADLVGAGGQDLARAIADTAKHGGYRYFWFTYTPTAELAQELQQRWAHRYRPSDNQLPAITHGEWRCTIPGCATCALAPVTQ